MRILILALLTTFSLSAQKLSTRSGYVKFFSGAAVEDIEAVNQQSSSILNLANGQFAFLVPVKAFQFEKALMQEHFNENYMESGKYPNASFKGNVLDFEQPDLTKNQSYQWQLKGIMSIHGVDQPVEQAVQVEVKEGKLSLSGDFFIKASDYKVEIPASKKDNISNDLKITVKFQYD